MYPVFRATFKDAETVFQAFEEHHIVHLLVDELRRFRMRRGSSIFDAKMKVLKELVRHHVEEEERYIFPKAVAYDLDWDSLYEKAQRLKTKLKQKKHRRVKGSDYPRAA